MKGRGVMQSTPGQGGNLHNLLTSANHSDSSGLARSLVLSFSRVAAARRIPVLPPVLQRNSGFLARARHARGNDRKIRPSGRAVSLFYAGLNKIEVHSLGALVTNLGSS